MPSEKWFFNEECARLNSVGHYCEGGYGAVNGCPEECEGFVGKDDEEDDHDA